MTAQKQLAIYMDHAHAHAMEVNPDATEIKTIDSPFTHQEKEETIRKSENVMHNKEQHEEHAYYKGLGNMIRNYDMVLLFGPTGAKAELHNLLKDDHNFSKIKIEVKPSDKLNEHQQHAFVREYFSMG